MKSSHKLKNERSKYIQAIEQPLISIDLKFFINQMKLRYLKSILQSRSSLLPSYCSSLCNRVWKKTMFFIFSFFHFLCNLRISTGPLSVTKNEIFCNLQYIFFINFTNIWFYYMIKCKFCNKIIIVTYFNDYFSIIIQFYSFLIFDFDPR